MEANDLAVDGQPILHALVDDSEHSLDSGAIMCSFCLVVLDEFEEGAVRCDVGGVLGTSLDLGDATLDALHHIAGLFTSVPEYGDPFVLSEFFLQNIGILFEILPLLLELLSPHFQVFTGRREDLFGTVLELLYTHGKEIETSS